MIHVRKLLLLVLVCSPIIVAAENPFVGTWKENLDKSYNSGDNPGGALPAGARASPDRIRIESAGENRVKITQIATLDGKQGKQQETTVVTTLDGSDVHPTGATDGFTQAFRQITPNVWERIAKQPGQPIRQGYWAVSRDGKMLIITGYSKSSNGQDNYFHRVLERQ
jgi:hypothetical protein